MAKKILIALGTSIAVLVGLVSFVVVVASSYHYKYTEMHRTPIAVMTARPH